MPGSNNSQESIAKALTEVSERMTALVRDEIELAKAEMVEKVSSIARGAAAVAAGAVFGVFAFIFALFSIAWGINSATGDLWPGFVAVLVLLVIATAGAFLFAWRKLKVGAPKPTQAIDEAKKIRATVTARTEGGTTITARTEAPLSARGGSAG